jgi:hypothetical protein
VVPVDNMSNLTVFWLPQICAAGAAAVPAGAAISGTADGVVAGAPILCPTE